MRIALCNEVIAPMPFPAQCAYAAKLGYDGLEIAPYTLSDEPHRLGSAQLAAARAAAADAGIAITGLHWLLVKPAGLSISTRDDAVRRRSIDVMLALIDQCAELGGRYLVHGSPHQRRVEPGETRAAALARARDSFAAVAERAEKAGVLYCIEALSAEQTPLINTLEEAARIVKDIGSTSIKSMLDCSAAGRMEKQPLAALVERWLPEGVIAHVQLNDRNRRGPGQGEQKFAPLFAALRRHRYDGDVAVEPFDYVPDGPGAAARAIGYVRGVLEALDNPTP
ncbi:MAG: sugar phosphate isomerase/epimerase [Betaproteobacteria bacterium]|nr:MAG: sugar phosphate isomerase/epimerase [Betaproteobacteria bacterium]TMI01275.1 MAG: sugar phosphate isomerase/epimerase [Betaproteobacteria bacterium]TMI12860.1 MAG: sugar phosphate isomerase/epimerase [Betaproteobacteria bacterium]TMI35606.1 MAG: sugar phosphate isomerase/epimerase [Betaproteobacteria bacterium]